MEHPIEGIMRTTLENIKDMVDVNTVVGDAIKTPDGNTIIPVSRVSFGFVAGGGEYGKGVAMDGTKPAYPFAGGTGAGVSLSPTAFLVVSGGQVRLLPACFHSTVDRMIELIPHLVDSVKCAIEEGKKKYQANDGSDPDFDAEGTNNYFRSSGNQKPGVQDQPAQSSPNVEL